MFFFLYTNNELSKREKKFLSRINNSIKESKIFRSKFN